MGGVLNFKRTYGVALDWLFAGAGEPPPFRLRVVSFVRAGRRSPRYPVSFRN